MARENLMEAIGDIAREKGIDRSRLETVIQEAVTQAAKRKFRQYEDIEARINSDTGELEVFRYKTVAEECTDPENQIPLDEAKKLDTLAEPGDEVEYEIDNKELSRVISQTARQLIFQKIREAERETIYENFKDRVGEVMNGVVSRTERGRTFVTLNQTEAILYRREQIQHERYSGGDHIRVILLDVLNDPKEPSQLVISRADPELLVKLFEMEVPEVYDGVVEIVNAAREPGRRAKIAVRSHDPDVDAVGACVGLRGSRVQAIISELRGEKIDIIHYSEDLPTYVANALAPAELSRLKIKEEENEIDAEVESDQLSLAIGRGGQNVRLASKLVGYNINVMSSQDGSLSLEEQIRQSLLASQAQLGMIPEGEATTTVESTDGDGAEVAPLTDGEASPEAGEAAPETEEAAPAAEATQEAEEATEEAGEVTPEAGEAAPAAEATPEGEEAAPAAEVAQEAEEAAPETEEAAPAAEATPEGEEATPEGEEAAPAAEVTQEVEEAAPEGEEAAPAAEATPEGEEAAPEGEEAAPAAEVTQEAEEVVEEAAPAAEVTQGAEEVAPDAGETAVVAEVSPEEATPPSDDNDSESGNG